MYFCDLKKMHSVCGSVLCHIGNRASSSTGKTSTSTRWVTSVALKLKSFSSKGHGSKSGPQRDHKVFNVFSSSNLPKWINDFEYICKWAVCQLCVGWDTHTPQVSLQSGYLSGHSHRWLGFCSLFDVLCHLKMNFLYQLSDLSDKALAGTCEQGFALSCAGNKCLKPKKCYFQTSNGWKTGQFHVGRGDWHQLTSIDIN